jgi:hypothetical protein
MCSKQDLSGSFDSCCTYDVISSSDTTNSITNNNSNINNSGSTNNKNSESISNSRDSRQDDNHNSSSLIPDTDTDTDVSGSSTTASCTSSRILTPAEFFYCLSLHQQRITHYKLLGCDPAAATCRAMVSNKFDIYIYILTYSIHCCMYMYELI